MTRTGLPPGEVLLDAATVLRELADAATPGHRSYVQGVAYVDGETVGFFPDDGGVALWAAFGPDEARLVADLLEILGLDWPGDGKALDLAYALTGHQRADGNK